MSRLIQPNLFCVTEQNTNAVPTSLWLADWSTNHISSIWTPRKCWRVDSYGLQLPANEELVCVSCDFEKLRHILVSRIYISFCLVKYSISSYLFERILSEVILLQKIQIQKNFIGNHESCPDLIFRIYKCTYVTLIKQFLTCIHNNYICYSRNNWIQIRIKLFAFLLYNFVEILLLLSTKFV